jgi:hypothetical protein
MDKAAQLLGFVGKKESWHASREAERLFGMDEDAALSTVASYIQQAHVAQTVQDDWVLDNPYAEQLELTPA